MMAAVFMALCALGTPTDDLVGGFDSTAGEDDIFLGDDKTLGFGNTYAAPDCRMEWDTAATPDALQLWCTDVDGIGTDGVVCYVDSGTRIWHCLGGLTIDGTLSGVSALDGTSEATVEAAIDTLANLTSVQSQSVSLSGGLTVEAGGCVCNQDMTTDAAVEFAGITCSDDFYIPVGKRIYTDGDQGSPDDYFYAPVDNQLYWYLSGSNRIQLTTNRFKLKGGVQFDLDGETILDGSGDVTVDDDLGVTGIIVTPGIIGDLAATCTQGEWGYDNAGATEEICFCKATNTWFCTPATAGPVD